MNPSFLLDFPYILSWWAVLFVIGAAAFPLSRVFFRSWWDHGYVLSKSLGLAAVTFFVWQMGMWKILPFTIVTIIIGIIALFISGIVLHHITSRETTFSWKKILLLELLFFISLCFWSFIKAHEPDVRSLEKFMDYGFSQTILNSTYFPPPDMWYAGGTINYYYFGHLSQAVLSRLSGVDLSIGYNLMLATLFAFCFSMSFGIGVQLYLTAFKQGSILVKKKSHIILPKKVKLFAITTGLLSAFLVSLSGNMQTMYAFTKGYTGENPPPVWTVLWNPQEFSTQVGDGINRYWYANATRFIPFTIHEFPGYSFVVSDNHGHVLGIPFSLLAIASLLTLFGIKKKEDASAPLQLTVSSMRHYLPPYVLYGGLLGILLMTNALDGPIYFGLFTILLLFNPSVPLFTVDWFKEKGIKMLGVFIGLLWSCLPFLLTFTSFASGLAINCPPEFLSNTKIGPILFEGVEKCQHSPFWMLWILWGFFWFSGIVFTLLLIKRRKKHAESNKSSLTLRIKEWWLGIPSLDRTLLIFFISCIGLILFSEFFYFKDIYPAHFRSNTMFKLGYQAFMINSFITAYICVRMISETATILRHKIIKKLFFVVFLPQLFLVSIFPVFAVRSYFGNLQTYHGIQGLHWFIRDFPDDYKATMFLKAHIQEKQKDIQPLNLNWLSSLSVTDVHVKDNFFTSHIDRVPVVLEADGDSYTDFNRVSAFSGVPTVIGWGVHEWLWRGTYDVVSPRKGEVAELYETGNVARIKQLLEKYNIQYIFIGTLERQKFPLLDESRFNTLGQVMYRSGQTVILSIDK